MRTHKPASRPLPGGAVRLRDQQQALTKQTILAAARQLFSTHGYAGTSIRTLARQAGVSPQTIYSVYGSKAGVAVGVVDLIDQEAGIPDLFDQRYGVDDPAELLGLLARMARQARERCADVLMVLRSGAAVEPDLAAARAEGLRRHREGIEAIVNQIHRSGALIESLSEARAADVAMALMTDEVCDSLVGDAGWTYDEYERWLHATLADVLLKRVARVRRKPGLPGA